MGGGGDGSGGLGGGLRDMGWGGNIDNLTCMSLFEDLLPKNLCVNRREMAIGSSGDFNDGQCVVCGRHMMHLQPQLESKDTMPPSTM